MVKAIPFVAAIMLAVAAAARAQEIPAPRNPPPATPPVAAPAGPPAASAPTQGPSSRRRDISRMERVLTQALQEGAQNLAQQLKVREPNSAFVTGTGRARGFILDGYGIFFDVDVPGMRQSVIWSAQMLELEQQRQSAEQFLANTSPNHPLRKVAEANLRQIARMMGTPPDAVQIPITGNAQMAERGRVEALTVADAVAATAAAAPSGVASRPPAVPVQQLQQLRDPNELYTEAVKQALIDAMLDFSGFLKIAEHEWLTVAASDSDGPQIPGQIDDASRIVIRIKGADLAAFQAGKLTRANVLKKVDVKEF